MAIHNSWFAILRGFRNVKKWSLMKMTMATIIDTYHGPGLMLRAYIYLISSPRQPSPAAQPGKIDVTIHISEMKNSRP